MKNKSKHVFMICCLGLALALLLGVASPGSAAPQADPVIHKVYVTNLRDGSFVVSWTTDIASDGKVTYGTTTPPGTLVIDPVGSTTTHYVEVNGLTANTTYYFKVGSGATEDNNAGSYYQVTTGPALLITPGTTAWGYMYQSNGTTVIPNAIVYLQLQDANASGSSGSSQWASARTDSAGTWNLDLANIRTSDFQAQFVYTGGADNLRIAGQAGVLGTKGADPSPWIVTAPSALTQFDIIIVSAPTAVKLVNLTANTGNTSLFLPVIALLAVALGGGMTVLAFQETRKRSA